MLADYGVDKYDIGTGFGHFGIAVEDVSSYFLKWGCFSLMQTTVVLHSTDSALSSNAIKMLLHHFCRLYIESHVDTNNSICVFRKCL